MADPLLTPPPSGLAEVPFEDQVAAASAALDRVGLPRDLSQVMVALDVDGTLLTEDGASPRVQAAFSALIDEGATVVIATGRGLNATSEVFQYIDTGRGWSVSANGAMTLDWDLAAPGGYRIADVIRFDPARVIERALAVLPDAYFAASDVRANGNGDDGEVYLLSRDFPPRELHPPIDVVGIDALRATRTTKLVIREPDMDVPTFQEAIDSMGLDDWEVAVGWTAWADVSPKGVTKASGLAALAERLGIAREGIVAVGDGTNDVPMFRLAGFSAAMGGATAPVRAEADHVTGPVEHDGAAAVMEAILRRGRARRA